MRERAYAYCLDANRPVPHPELAEAVFQTRASDDHVSHLLLRTLLRHDERFRQSKRGMWELSRPAWHALSLSNARFVVVDLEATGSNVQTDRIIEVGMVVIEGLRVRSHYATLVNPMVRIPRWIRRLTGIDEAALQDAPRFHQVAPQILELLDGGIFVAHNVDFDYPFLREHLSAAGHDPSPWPTMCTVRLAAHHFPNGTSCRLGSLAAICGIELENHHRAVDDARATAEVFLHILKHRVGQKSARTVGDLLDGMSPGSAANRG
jgi:DNA polymerase III epsilon subunit family exonuclease